MCVCVTRSVGERHIGHAGCRTLVDNRLESLTIEHVFAEDEEDGARPPAAPAAAAPNPAVIAIRGAAASLQQRIPDALIKALSEDDIWAVLLELFEVKESDFLDHPSFREAGSVDPVAFPDYARHALVTALAEQGAIFSAEVMTWLRPLSIIPTDVFDLTFLWGKHPEYELRIQASRVYHCGRTKELAFRLAK